MHRVSRDPAPRPPQLLPRLTDYPLVVTQVVAAHHHVEREPPFVERVPRGKDGEIALSCEPLVVQLLLPNRGSER